MQLLPVILALLNSFSVPNEPLKLTVNISDVRSESGQILVAIYDQSSTFMNPEKGFRAISILPKEDNVTLSVDLPKGAYAIAVLHDENADEQMNQNWLGIPTEGYGFSNNPSFGFSKPTFEDCRIDLVKPEQSVEIDLVHW